MAKVYVASSWSNEYQPRIVAFLREREHEVYDFRNPERKTDFRWSQISGNWEKMETDEYWTRWSIRWQKRDSGRTSMPCGRPTYVCLCSPAGLQHIPKRDG